ncbi:MAG: hypothetical protein AAFX81_19955 [Pseudomonadota bacterium]
MPNFDTGHYFLTTLAPVKAGATVAEDGTAISYLHRLRQTLAVLPTALQSPATERIGSNSPFARNRRTHLCRFAIIDDVVYNGRPRSDAIVNALRNRDPIKPEPVDRLNRPYLLFAADFDAVKEEGESLPATLSAGEQDAVRDSFGQRLWATMEPELRAVYANCEGFDAVSDGRGFADYLRRCQVETTMPFNDYWLHPPKLNELRIAPLAILVGVPLLLVLLGLVGWLFGMNGIPLLGWSIAGSFWGGLVATALAVWLAYQLVLRNGAKPMPPGEYADLPSVLKSLYLQQAFADFVIAQQGASDADLHRAFGTFLKTHEPEDKMTPSQPPGVIASDRADTKTA